MCSLLIFINILLWPFTQLCDMQLFDSREAFYFKHKTHFRRSHENWRRIFDRDSPIPRSLYCKLRTDTECGWRYNFDYVQEIKSVRIVIWEKAWMGVVKCNILYEWFRSLFYCKYVSLSAIWYLCAYNTNLHFYLM